MKAIVIHEFGNRNTLQLAEIPTPEPQEGEVLIRIRAAGVNPVDFKIREGLLRSRMPFELPVTLGWDVAGIVEKNGFGASRFMPGDHVFAYARRTKIHQGTYAEYITLPESFISPMPVKSSFEQASATPLAALTAYQSILQRGKLQAGEKILILGATGGVGSFAIQIARITGAHVTAVASSKKAAYARSIGADEFIAYDIQNVGEYIEKKHPDRFDLVFDCAGRNYLTEAYGYVRPGGRLVSVLAQANEELVQKYKVQFHYVFVEPNARQLGQIASWTDEGRISVHIDALYSLEDAAKAHELMETSHTQGKIVLTIKTG